MSGGSASDNPNRIAQGVMITAGKYLNIQGVFDDGSYEIGYFLWFYYSAGNMGDFSIVGINVSLELYNSYREQAVQD